MESLCCVDGKATTLSVAFFHTGEQVDVSQFANRLAREGKVENRLRWTSEVSLHFELGAFS